MVYGGARALAVQEKLALAHPPRLFRAPHFGTFGHSASCPPAGRPRSRRAGSRSQSLCEYPFVTVGSNCNDRRSIGCGGSCSIIEPRKCWPWSARETFSPPRGQSFRARATSRVPLSKPLPTCCPFNGARPRRPSWPMCPPVHTRRCLPSTTYSPRCSGHFCYRLRSPILEQYGRARPLFARAPRASRRLRIMGSHPPRTTAARYVPDAPSGTPMPG